MSYLNRLSDLQEYGLANFYQYIEMAIYSFACIMIPIMLSHPQIVVGTVVNAMLVLAALNLKGYKLLPVIITPSIGVVIGAVLFGPLTAYIFYMMPFIWIGNAILVFSFKLFRLKQKRNYLVTLLIGSAAKSGFLFISALALYLLGVIPIVFLTAMGILQLATALFGGVGAYAVQYAKSRL